MNDNFKWNLFVYKNLIKNIKELNLYLLIKCLLLRLYENFDRCILEEIFVKSF